MSGTEYCHPGEAEELSEMFRILCDAGGVLGDYALYRLKDGEWVAGSEYQKLEDENARLRELARTAPRVIVSDPSTDCATGHCECGACGGAIDMWDNYCRHCGARLEDA